MEDIIKYVAPSLTGVLIFLLGEKFIEPPDKYSRGWKIVGLLFPALWLTAHGPTELMNNGGFIMQAFNIDATKEIVIYFSLVWFIFFLICFYLLSKKIFENKIIVNFIYAFGHCGLMGSLGAFIFIAIADRQ